MTALLPVGQPAPAPEVRNAVDAVAVVIPARDEEATIGACLDAVLTAARAIALPVAVLVVADRCTDATADRARSAAQTPASPDPAAGPTTVTVLSSGVGQVGAARDRGVRTALRSRRAANGPDGGLWIACTDADSRVPPDWLSTHLELAAAGADLVLGTVRPDPFDLPTDLLEHWRRRQQLTDGHPHIHGANLGIRGDIYVAVGGFPHIACHEDVWLADAVRLADGRIEATGRAPVLTSGRRVGRAPAGLSSYLRELADLDPPA